MANNNKKESFDEILKSIQDILLADTTIDKTVNSMYNSLNMASNINAVPSTSITGGTGSSKNTISINPGSTFTVPYPYTFNTANYTQATTRIDGHDVIVGGKSLKDFMEKVEERLLILQPDPAKLEKYAALKKAYEHYKMMEKLVSEE
jgi:hypothetical protein